MSNTNPTPQTWAYGLQFRPLSLGTAPRDFLIDSLKPGEPGDHRIRHGIIEYARPLTEEEIAAFQLVDLNPKPLPSREEAQAAYDQALEHWTLWKELGVTNDPITRAQYLDALMDAKRILEMV